MKNSGVTVDEWVAAGTEIRELAHKMIYGKTIDLADGSPWQPKVFAAALLGRSMMAQKCALILAQAGMVTGTKLHVRVCFEAAIWLRILKLDGMAFVQAILDDSKAQEKSFAKKLLPASDFLDNADRKILQAQADQSKTPRIELGEKLDARGNREDYLVFRMLSDDAVHASVNSLRKHLPQNASGMNTEFFVEPPHEEIDLGQSLHYVLAGLLNVMMLYYEIVEDPTALPPFQNGIGIFRRLVAASGYDPELEQEA